MASSPPVSSSLPSAAPSTATQRWKEKVIGISILSVYLLGIHWMTMSLWTTLSRSPLASTDTAALILLWAATACSFLNVTSHLLVVLNIIRNVSVISILIGVGFDVLSWIDYAMAFVAYTTATGEGSVVESLASSTAREWISIVAITSLLLWNLLAHLRALVFFQNLDRLEQVVRSTHNNLIGEPGWYGMDHIFAYSDLGNHIVVLVWCVQRIRWECEMSAGLDEVFETIDTPTAMSSVATIFVTLLIGRWITSRNNAKEAIKEATGKTDDDTASNTSWTLSLVQSSNTKSSTTSKLICDCPVCRNQTSFKIFPSLCRQWMSSFEELLAQVERIKVEMQGVESKQEPTKAGDGAQETTTKKFEKQTTPKKDKEDDDNDNGWRCACEGGFLPPGMLKSFGGAEAVLRLGTGQCYHKQ